MKMPSLLPATALALALTLVSTDALAWGAQGHRLVARIAETRLTPQTQAEVDRLLAAEPDPTLHAIAPWADQLRAKDPGLGKRSAGWHYVNIGEDDCHYEVQKHCRNGNCVVEALKAQTAILGDRSKSDAERAQALKFVVHFAGDIHQPMHAGYGHDKGGNDFQVQFNNRGTNLHSLWDSGMLNEQTLDDDQYLKRLLALPKPAFATRSNIDADAVQWAEASCRIAIAPGVYPDKRTLEPSYAATYRPVAERELRLAGERLAVLLNDTLGKR
ncbi:endonuclease [Stenotrophomonas maltophilia]|uniref:Endonuclease n=1 Tax=Stenotrophomonas maltophilia TaxID=40324 RepID=A0A246HRM1_STEMA|nr:S1/P1 nuclease [Stenotrophomonas maltophilia]OWQ56008.1 endonuclease [Stenotrophomonas maltophilia]